MFRPCLWITLFSFNLLVADYHARFESFEHVAIGDKINLSGINGKLLHLPNGLALSFGNILAMPDFYGIPGSQISDGTNFMAAFDTLAKKQSTVSEATRIIAAIHVQKPNEDQNLQWNCLTGGACSGATWWLTPGRYLLLAATDFDHFGDDAITAYLAGHKIAIKTALEAGKTRDTQVLERAYAMDAFACHFLTDRFSSGHIRIPRHELSNNVTPPVIGSLLANFMHDEESAAGLHVHNQAGDQWIAYGDRHYSDSKNKDNLAITQKAVQLSVDDVYQAFSNGQFPATYQQLSLIPQADETNNIAPLFYWDFTNNVLMRRVSLNNPNDHHWTSDWVGWSTLAALKIMLHASTKPE